MHWIYCMPRGLQPAFGKCHNRIRPFGGVSRFQREQAMNEDIDLSIWRAPMESAMCRAARSNGGLSAKLQWIVEDQSVVQSRRGAPVGRRYAPVCSCCPMPHVVAGVVGKGSSSLKSRQRTEGCWQCWPRGCRGYSSTAAEVVLPIQSQHDPCQDFAVRPARSKRARGRAVAFCCENPPFRERRLIFQWKKQVNTAPQKKTACGATGG